MKINEWVRQNVSQGRITSNYPSSWSEIEKTKARREALGKICEVDITKIPVGENVLEKASGRNIEQAIGVTNVPLGVAGPLRLRSGQANKSKNYFLPMATTEGALVASVNRGCKAIAEAGGAAVYCEDKGMTRGPVFRMENIKEGKNFEKWLVDNFHKLKEVCEKTSRHLRLLDIKTQLVGRSVFVRFRFDTQEAMGMNMATIATQAAVDFIEEKGLANCVSLSGNFCVDKKPAWLNSILGRGKQVWAEVVLDKEVISSTLKTSQDRMLEVGYRKILIGSALSGSMGFNAQQANVIAALFLATGQDIAHVVEGSLGMTTVEREGEGILIGVYLPSVLVGVVGGGTELPTQKKALEILDLGKGKKGEAEILAGIIGGAVLAGEISLLASLAEGSLARAHLQLGRRESK